MALHTVASGFESKSLAAECPFGIAVGVAAFGKVHYLAAVGFYQGYIHIVPTAYAYVACKKPFAVGGPLEAHIAVGVGVVIFAVEGCVDFL